MTTACSLSFKTDQKCNVALSQTYFALKIKLFMLTKHAIPKKLQRAQRWMKRGCRKRWGNGRRRSSSTGHSCNQHFLFNFFPVLRWISTISETKTLLVYMRTNLSFPTFSKVPSSNTSDFCIASVMTTKNILLKVSTTACLNPFSQRGGNYLVDLMIECCMLKWWLTFSPILIRFTQFWKLGYN